MTELIREESDLYRVAIIGVGRGGQGVGGHSIGHAHAYTYQRHQRCRIVAAADIVGENLNQFAGEFGTDTTFGDYHQMLSEARPDIVSISAYAGLRREMVEAVVEAGVKGIWCEKPFALSMDDGETMVGLCERHGVKLVVNHQRRYASPFREAKRRLKQGGIGRPVVFLAALKDWDLMEWGTHWLDMFRFFADDQPVSWVMGQVRCTGAKRRYGHVMEEHAIAYLSFEDGTRGTLEGGLGLNADFAMRLVGTEGLLDLYTDGTQRLLNDSGWRTLPAPPVVDGSTIASMLSVLDGLIGWMEGGPKPEVAGDNALRSTELYLAAYESSLRGDRIDLPLQSQARFPLEAISDRQMEASR